ncbi:ATP-dependent DNA helicase [Halodesulfurarchaeum formicicum]|uniref:ATP-dependent DNA helicase n=1 Tax=Halodesulfurarchaeum formicicum TaxID=1873524 RepID=A0A1J1ADN9_9EURY|nr:3'-5' exonuclease [Halodesulfurarchaeum formicicum]APE95697.1 ATP-dependent DNA helicase [Halodesulfurarchaeum formicicum]
MGSLDTTYRRLTEYALEGEDGQPRPPTHGDIAVFTRTRDYGRELLGVAEEYDIPMAYDGGIELYRTDPAKLLLAWLRILDTDADRGWAVVLEQAGYTLDEIDHILATDQYPEALQEFHTALEGLDAIGAVARQVFDRYGISGETADGLLHTLQSLYETTTVTPGDVIQLIEAGIDTGSTVEVHTNAGEDSVTVQTIHAAKGLEYPIVIMANMNDGSFPPRTRNQAVIQYQEPVGLRQRKLYATEDGVPHIYDNWRYDVIRQCLGRDLDEERRLLYVGITRAESHLVVAGGAEPNTFLDELPVAVEAIEPSVEAGRGRALVEAELPFTVPVPEGPIGETPHSLMDESVFEADSESDGEPAASTGGVDFGQRLHAFAEAYALGEGVSPSDPHQERVAAFLDGLDGELHAEQPATLPIEVDGKRVSISGVIDLVHETADQVEIIDYKTDRTRRAESEYRTQLSVYHHVLDEWFPEKAVTASILYTQSGKRVQVEPLGLDELREVVPGTRVIAGPRGKTPRTLRAPRS